MDANKQYIHERILDDWEKFPWKLDYILYLVYTNDENIISMQFRDYKNVYEVFVITENSFAIKLISKEIKEIEWDRLTIKYDEMWNYLKQNKTPFVQFPYATQIFTEEHIFTVERTIIYADDSIIFRLLKNSDNIEFNNKLEQYSLSYAVNQELPINTGTIEKRIKV